MTARYQIVPAGKADLPAVFALIDQRIRWLQARNNPQWDTYREAYPDEYFRALAREQRLYLLKAGDFIAAMAALFDRDPLWADGAAALYVHNLAADTRFPGAGRAILEFCEAQARAQNCDFLRLDCSAKNPQLNDYYEGQGFTYVATCPGDIYYTPNLRERVL